MINIEDSWVSEFPGAVTICNEQGIILAMNQKAIETFQREGGQSLIGKNALECHPEPARTKFANMLTTHESNVYTIKKGGKKKLIYQAPWFHQGNFRGIVELSLEIPGTMPHFIREG
jgi:transcriptional regulator with PAS, ATPase and Fis domain